MNEYEAKLEARRERLERAAARATQESDDAFRRARQATEGIVFGQPILVGHHSESKHRNAIKRSDNAMRRACEAADAAKELAARAAAVGTGGISSDDPAAVEKLADKRTELEQRRDWMKSANAYHKANGSLDGWDGPAAMADEAMTNIRIWRGGPPFPRYALTNIGARIRDAAKRAARITATADAIDSGTLTKSTRTVNGYTITDDPADNRVNVSSPVRLSRDDYQTVRRHGFVWSPSRNAFTRKRMGSDTVRRAMELARAITPVATAEVAR